MSDQTAANTQPASQQPVTSIKDLIVNNQATLSQAATPAQPNDSQAAALPIAPESDKIKSEYEAKMKDILLQQAKSQRDAIKAQRELRTKLEAFEKQAQTPKKDYKTDPLSVLTDHSLSLDDLTEALNKSKDTKNLTREAQEALELKQRLERIENERQEEVTRKQDGERHQATVQAFNDFKSFLDKEDHKDEYEVVKSSNFYEQAFQKAAQRYQEDPESFRSDEEIRSLYKEEALKIENHLLEEVFNLAQKSNKVKNKLKALFEASQSKEPEQRADESKPNVETQKLGQRFRPTLTNSQSVTTAKSNGNSVNTLDRHSRLRAAIAKAQARTPT